MAYAPINTISEVFKRAKEKTNNFSSLNGDISSDVAHTTPKSNSLMGMTAKSPELNKQPKVNTLASSQVKPQAPQNIPSSVPSNPTYTDYSQSYNIPQNIQQTANVASSYPSVVKELANTGTADAVNTPAKEYYAKASQSLDDLSKGQTDLKKAIEDYNKFAQSAPYMEAAQFNPNVAADVASGRSGLLGQTFGKVLGAKAQAVQNALAEKGQQIESASTLGSQALTGQGQRITGLGTAGELAKPVTVTPGNALVSPESGGELYSGIGGLVGLAAAQNNIEIGQKLQNQAVNVDLANRNIEALAPKVVDFLRQTGLNEYGTPWFNKSIKTYIEANENPTNVRALNSYIAEIKNFQQQIIQSSGLTPTDAGHQIATYNPEDLSFVDLQNFIHDLAVVGQTRKAVLDKMTSEAYSSVKGSQNQQIKNTPIYVGEAGNPNLVPNVSMNIPTILNTSPLGQSPVFKGLVGTVMRAPEAVAGTVGFFKSLFD